MHRKYCNMRINMNKKISNESIKINFCFAIQKPNYTKIV